MKLMKKNSSVGSSLKKAPQPLKIDWNRLADRKASVHSEELSPVIRHEEHLDELLQVKKKIKEIEGEHRKMVEIALVLESLLETDK